MRVPEHDLERFGDFFRRCAAAHVEEVGRAAAVKLDRVHGRHGKARAVDQATDVAIERDVGEIEFGGFDFRRVFFVQIAHGDDLRVTEQGIGIEVELGVERDDTVVAGDDERVDFRQ